MSPTQNHRPAFDSHAADYEDQCLQGLALSGEPKEFFARGRVAFLHEWWEREARPAPRRIIDYGCGLGDGAAILSKAFPEAQVLGLDPSARCIERARQSHESERVAFSTLDEIGSTEADPADLVHLNGVTHHVAPGDRPQLFSALSRVVAPGGVLALFENNPLNPGTRLVMARIPFDRDAVPVPAWEARRRLRTVKLKPLYTGYLFYFPRPLAGLRPLERWLVRLPLGAQYGVLAVSETSDTL